MFLGFLVVAMPVGAISKEQTDAISKRCDTIQSSLKLLQKQDARARVYLGGQYETILSKYMIPLNVRLVENSLASPKLTENQNDFAAAKKTFNDDYISYQQKLEELVTTDCKKAPEEFYDKLVKVRSKRKTVSQDVSKLREIMNRQVELVKGLKEKI